MEERIVDKDDPRLIKFKRKGEETDAVDELTPDDGTDESEETEESEVTLALPEEEYDEDLVGLTPSQLEKKLEARRIARERADAEYHRLMAAGEALLSQKKYAEAEPLFVQAELYEADDGSAKEKIWIARTENYTSTSVLYEEGVAQELVWADEPVRERVLGAMREKLKAEREAFREESVPLRERYTAAKEERAQAFKANMKYYLVRLFIVLAVAVAFAIGCAVSATYIVRRNDDLALILTIVFAVAALITLLVGAYFAHKLYVAVRLVKDNEKPSSTEDGAHLKELEEKLACLDLILGE